MHLICYLPAAFVIMRYSVVKLLFNKIYEELPPVMHTVVSISMVSIITFIVLVLRSTGLSSGEAFSLVLDLTGGLAGSLTSFIIPTAVFIKLVPDDGGWRHIEAKVLFCTGFLLMIVVCTSSIMGVV